MHAPNKCANDPCESIESLLASAIGQGPAGSTPHLLEEVSSRWIEGGVVLRDFLAINSLGERFTITVAEPFVRKFSLPVIAAHQTNIDGRREVFGIAGDTTLDYGLVLALRGHRVFGIDLRWTGDRAVGDQWAFSDFQKTYPDWSVIGADCRDFQDLIFLIREEFGERSPINWIGHSHGGVNGYVLAALEPAGTFLRVVCNAAYVGFPTDADISLQALAYFRKPFSEHVWRHLDSLISLACKKSHVRLNCYRSDKIIPVPIPSISKNGEESNIEKLDIAIYDGSHEFSDQAKESSAQFLEGAFLPPQELIDFDDARIISRETNDHSGSVLSVSSAPIETLPQAKRENYFEFEEVWADLPEPYQVQTRETLKAWIPSDVETVLDAGCGNGHITNFLPPHLRVTGLDLSETALRNVRVPHIQGSVTALPFPDKSYDLVYCFDVIEHLSEQDFVRALHELQRVAKKYVLIAVPLNEDVESNFTQCADCGVRYHINGHLRAFTPESLNAIPSTEEFDCTAVFLSGDTTVPPQNSLIDLYWELNVHPTLPHAQCPQCGSSRQSGGMSPSSERADRLADSLRSAEWAKHLAVGSRWSNRSEGMLLLTRKGHGLALLTENCNKHQASLLDLDFGNLLQAVNPDFVPGTIWSRFKPGAGTQIYKGGITLHSGKASQSTPTAIRIPVVPKAGDQIFLEVSGGDDAELSLYGIDGVSSRVLTLLERKKVPTSERHRIAISIEAAWSPDRFGLALDLYIYGKGRVHALSYSPSTEIASDSEFATIQPGFNIVQIPGLKSAGYWTFYSTASGAMPIATVTTIEHAPSHTTFQPLLSALAETKSQNEQLNANLTHVKLQNEQLSADLSRLKLQNEQLTVNLSQANLLNESLTANLGKVDEKQFHFSPPIRFAIRIARGIRNRICNLARKTKRLVVWSLWPNGRLDIEACLKFPERWRSLTTQPNIKGSNQRLALVLSHMFPHPDQPGLGSFVLEQVAALRKAGVDAHVLSARPYWLTQTRNPLHLLGLLWDFFRLHKMSSNRWWEIDGVPVKYVPYPIVGPFWTHGWSYRLAIQLSKLNAKYHLIHAHTGYLDGSAAKMLSRRFRIPYLITEHTGPFSMLTKNRTIRNSTISALAAAHKVIAVSTAQKASVSEHVPDKVRDSLIVLPNIVDTNLFTPPSDWTPNPVAPRLLFVGYFVPIKNLPLLIEAFRRVLAVRPGATLTLVGGGEVPAQEVALAEQIEQAGVASRVTVLGYMGREDVAALMRNACDILILCSRSETFGCVVAESLASGKPAIVTRCGGPEDIVTDPFLGRVCDNDDPDALANAINDLCDHLHCIDSQRIRDMAVDRYSAEKVAQKLVGLYNDISGVSANSAGCSEKGSAYE